MKNILPPESGKYLGVGVQLAAAFFLGIFFGYQADRRWGGGGLVFTAIGAALGIAAGFYNLYVQLTKRN